MPTQVQLSNIDVGLLYAILRSHPQPIQAPKYPDAITARIAFLHRQGYVRILELNDSPHIELTDRGFKYIKTDIVENTGRHCAW